MKQEWETYFRAAGRVEAEAQRIPPDPRRRSPSNAELDELAAEVAVVRDAYLAEHPEAAKMAAELVDRLADAGLTVWWSHPKRVAEQSLEARRSANDPALVVQVYNDALWSTIARDIASRRG